MIQLVHAQKGTTPPGYYGEDTVNSISSVPR